MSHRYTVKTYLLEDGKPVMRHFARVEADNTEEAARLGEMRPRPANVDFVEVSRLHD